MRPSDYASLRDRFQSTTYRTFSEFVRSALLGEPVVRKYRNASLDDILEELVELKNAVIGVGGKLDEPDVCLIKSTLIKIYEKCGQEGSGLPL